MFAGHCSKVDAVPVFKIERRVFESCLFKVSVVAHKYFFSRILKKQELSEALLLHALTASGGVDHLNAAAGAK